jgi:hypothetical protein
VPGHKVPDWLLHEAREADIQLQFLDAYEEFALSYDHETVLPLRHQFAEEYVKLTGVHPEHRDEYRFALKRIRDYELAARVQGLILSFRERVQRSGLSSCERASS